MHETININICWSNFSCEYSILVLSRYVCIHLENDGYCCQVQYHKKWGREIKKEGQWILNRDIKMQ